jgi:outer membrane protein TolC
MKRAGVLIVILVVCLSRIGLAGDEIWTLERAIEHSLTNSPEARIAQQRIAAARAGLEQANSAFWPQLQFESSYIRTDNPMLVFGSILNQRSFSPNLDFNDVPDLDNLNVRGRLTLPLYMGGEIRAGRRGAQANAEAARKQADAVRNTLAFEVARAYHTILKTREFVRASEAAVRGFEDNAAVARKRYNAGTVLKTDVLDVEVRLAQAREDAVRARNANALAQRALRNLLGIEGAGITVSDTTPDIRVPEHDDFTDRPELEVVRQQERAAAAAVRAAKSGYLPKLSAFGQLDYDYGWRTEGDGGSYTAGALVRWDLWDGRLTRGKVSEARANLEEVGEQETKIRLAIELQVQQARLRLEEAAARLRVTQTAVSQATESVELTRARFEQGLSIATQLIDAETALTAARVRRAEAEGEQRIAVAALRHALGMSQLD